MRRKYTIRKTRLSYGERARRRGIPPLRSFQSQPQPIEMPQFDPLTVVNYHMGLMAYSALSGGFRKGGRHD